MKRVHLFFTLLVSLLMLSSSVNLSAQKRLIVKPNYSGSATDTFPTIKLAVAAAGTVSDIADTVIVYDGIYKEKISFNRWNSPGNRTLVLASRFLLDGDTNHINNTIISGGGIVQSSQNDILVAAYGDNRNANWFQFVGFTVDSASKYGLYIEGGAVRNCVLRNSGASAYIPYLFQGTKISNSKIYNNFGPAIFAFSQIGSDANSSMWTVESSIFYNNKALSSNSERDDRGGPWNQQYIGGVIWSANYTKGRLSNNIFYLNNGDNIISSGGDRPTDTLDVFNNVFYKNNTKTAYFMNWWGQFGQNNYTTRWYNNIIDNNYTKASNNTYSEFAWGDGGTNAKPQDYYFKNNLLATQIGTTAGQTYNFSSSITLTYDTASQIIGVAKFKDINNLDFSLLPTSPGIGAGNVNFSTTKDFLGNTRPNPTGSNIDMGAVESILAMPTPSITSVQNAVIGSKKVIKINFSVFNNPKVDSIIIYRSTFSKDTAIILSSAGTYSATNIKKTISNSTSVFTDTTNILNSTKYYYAIKALINSGSLRSEVSAVDSISISSSTSSVSVPTSLTLSNSGRSSIAITWTSANVYTGTYSATRSKFYVDIYRGTTSSNASLLIALNDTTSSYTDKTTAVGNTYYYYLVNRDANGVVSDSSSNKSKSTPATIRGTSFYVDPSSAGSDVAGGGSGDPYKTITFAMTQALKGDTVVLLPGTYSEKVKINPGVTLGSKYIITPTDTASIRSTILDASTFTSGNLITYNAYETNNVPVWTRFVGLTLQGAKGKGNLLINTEQLWQKYASFDHCIFTNNGYKDIQWVDGRDANQDFAYAKFNDSTLIQNSIIENNSGKMTFGSSGLVIKNNIFRNNNTDFTKSNNVWCGTGIMEGWLNGYTLTGNIFSNNGKVPNNNNDYWQFYVIGFGGNTSDSAFITNNTFVNNNAALFRVDNNSSKTFITNNVFYHNLMDFYLNTSPATDFYVSNNAASSDLEISKLSSLSSVTFSKNLLISKNIFEDSTLFTLDPSSNLINSGTNTFGTSGSKSVPSLDLYGNARPGPAGTNSDIGAVESPFGFAAPILSSLDGSDKSMVVKWTKPINGTITGYEVFRSNTTILKTASTPTFTVAKGDSLILTDTNVVNLTKYYYRVRAYSGTSSKSYSAFSNELSAKPNVPPSNVDTVLAYAGPRSVALAWSDTSTVRRKYNIYRGTSAINLDKIASAVDTTYYIDNSATANAKFFYGIKVIDSVGAASTMSKLAYATASNVWVIDTAGKSSGNGSTKKPFKSIQYAIDNASIGDTILLNDGRYIENLKVVNKVVTIMAKNKRNAVITPLDATGASTLEVQDQNPWGTSPYPKASNKFIGLVFAMSSYTTWSNNPPSAININYNSNPVFESCIFAMNSSQFVFHFDQSAPLFINCLVINNNVTNGVFALNGGQDSSRPKTKVAKFINSVISNNTFISKWNSQREKTVVFYNSILSENGYDNQFNNKMFRVVNSIVDNSQLLAQSSTNISGDPQFNNTSNADYSLSNFSPALGAGGARLIIVGSEEKDTLNALTYDFNYATRPNPTGTKADLGAFENKYSIAAPQISRLQKSGTAITLTWAKTGTTTLSDVKIYRDTVRASLDTIAPLATTVDLTSATVTDVLPSSSKEYFYAIRATVGAGTSAVKTGLSNIKSTKDTIFVPGLNFIADTASIAIRAASRNQGSLVQSVNLVKLAADAEAALPKLIIYSQGFRQIDSTKKLAEDSLTALNLLAGTGLNKIKFALNKRVLVAKGKNDYMQLIGAMNVNGDDEFDLVGIYKNSNNLNNNVHISYLINNNLNFTLDTINPPANFFNPNVNQGGGTTNLVYKWDQKTFQYNDGQTNVGQNIESAVEVMDGNFDGKDELIVSLNQVKWEPNPTMNVQNYSLQNISANFRIVKFVDINNDGIPDIFAMTNNPWSVGLSQTNGNPMVVFVSNKKDGKFYLYVTGINVDWGASIYFGDFNNSRSVQVLTRAGGGNYKVYYFDNTYSASSADMQVNGVLNDGKLAVDDLNTDGYPDVVTQDNSGNFIAYLNNHRGSFDKKIIGASPFQTNAGWTSFHLRMIDLNRDGTKDLLWFEMKLESDGSIDWNTNNFIVRAWIQETGDPVRTAPTAIAASDITASNSGYKVKVKWTPSSDKIDPYLFANLKVDTLDTYASARINNSYNYRKNSPSVPIVLDRVYARNYPDSIEFNDLGISSKSPYYIKVQMVNKEGYASTFAEKLFIPKDPLISLDHNIPGIYGGRFQWGDFNNDGLLDLAVMGQRDNGNLTAIYQNKGGTFQDLNLTNKAYRYGDIKWVDLNNDGWLDVAMIGQPGGAGVGFQTLINNHGVFEVKTPSGVDGLKFSNLAFGDYDNNGTLDMFTSGQDAQGTAHSYLYTNDGKGNFTKVNDFNGAIPDMYNADARFVDYDLDGDLDLVYAGTGMSGGKVAAIGGVRVNTLLDPKMSTNNYGGGMYNNGYNYNLSSSYYDPNCNCSVNITIAMKNARFDIGDIDGDGDLDIVEIGTAVKTNGSVSTDVPTLLIIRNQTMEAKNSKFGNYFSYGSIYNISGLALDNITEGDVKLVDINNDGLLDITVAGLDTLANPVTKFYLNQGGFGNFTLSKNNNIPQYSSAAISWGDANGDGSMDLVISGQKSLSTSTSIFLNNQGDNSNVAPSTPKNLTFIDQGQGRILLQWDASLDDHTRPDNMYYNLKLGTQPGLSDLRVIQVNPKTDKLQTPNTSLIGSNKYYIELPPGVYYWSVQAVDGNFLSSSFAANQKIVLRYPWQFVNQGGIIDSRIVALENPAFAWADAGNRGVFDFLYLGTGDATMNQNSTPVGLYRNLGGKFAKLLNDSLQSNAYGKGTGFGTALSGISNAQIKWVDFNNDGLLDLVVAGDDITTLRGRLVVFKNNGNYKFENITNNVYTGEQYASPKIEFVDLDNNGYKDFIYTGLDKTGLGQVKFLGFYKDTVVKTQSGLLGIKVTPIVNNLDVSLTSKSISNVSLAIGDLNKDLKPDLAILYDDGDNAMRVGSVYLNTSDTSNKILFTLSSTISLPTARNATIDLIDYNNDGLLDLAISGRSDAGVIFRIYQNKWLDSAAKTIQFLQTNSNVKPFEKGQTTWGDINSDGYPDVIFSGTRPGTGVFSAMALADPSNLKTTGVMNYNELPTFPFGNYSVMRPSLGDFSGKKVLDLVLVGTEKVRNPSDNTTSVVSSFKILKNVRDLSARIIDSSTKVSIGAISTGAIKSLATDMKLTTTAETMIRSNSVRGFADSTIAVADSNFVESSYGSNNVPTSPKIDSSVIVSKIDTSTYLVKLTWKAASDDNTPSAGLTYAVGIGSKPGATDVLDANADLTTGVRKTPEMGNAGKNLSYQVLLKPGIYYWTVQAIDAANAGSKFTGTKTIQVTTTRTLVERNAPYDILLNSLPEVSYYLKQNDSAGIKYVLTALDNDTTAKFTYTIATDTASLFTIDASGTALRLKKLPTASAYAIKLRVTDNYGLYFDKIYTFQVVQAPNKLYVNGKDTSYFYYTKTSADSAKFTLSLNAFYNPTPAVDPVLTYKFVTGKGGENNDLFDLGSTLLVNKRKLDNADTLKLRVAAVDSYGLTVERLIYLINTSCPTVPSLTVKASATACLPLVVDLTDTLYTKGSAKGLSFAYYSDINATTLVPDPKKVATSGTYYVKALDTAGCGIAKPIAITVASLPAAPTVTAASVCQNQTSVPLTYTAPSSNIKLVWYGSSATGGTGSTATPSFNTSAAATLTYYVGQADTVAGCYSVDRAKLDIVVKAVPSAPVISRDTAGNLVSTVTSGVQWYRNDTAKVSTAGSFKPTAPGSYTIKATNNGCTSVASNAYYYLITDVINLSATEYIKLAPNPFINYLNFDFVVNGYQKLNIDVFATSNGSRVSSKQGVYAGSRLSYAELPAGVYIFRVTSADGKLSYQFKMIKL